MRFLILIFALILCTSGVFSAELTGIKIWTNENYMRVAIYLSSESTFTHTTQDKETIINISSCEVNPNYSIPLWDKDSPLDKILLSPWVDKSLKVTLKLKKDSNIEIAKFEEPFRIIIDLKEKEKPAAASLDDENLVNLIDKKLKERKEAKKEQPAEVKKDKIKRIIIDPGHGGKDTGTHNGKINEKDIVLSIGLILAEMVQDELKIKAILTRSEDVYLDLEERTAIANTNKANLFVSLHINHSSNSKTTGLQTFYLNMTTDKATQKLAARENRTKKVTTLEFIKLDLMKNMDGNESINFAQKVHQGTLKYFKENNSILNDVGVRPAMFYVLWGNMMPSILLELGFMSNKTERKLLINEDYQGFLAKAILNALKGYLNLP